MVVHGTNSLSELLHLLRACIDKIGGNEHLWQKKCVMSLIPSGWKIIIIHTPWHSGASVKLCLQWSIELKKKYWCIYIQTCCTHDSAKLKATDSSYHNHCLDLGCKFHYGNIFLGERTSDLDSVSLREKSRNSNERGATIKSPTPK